MTKLGFVKYVGSTLGVLLLAGDRREHDVRRGGEENTQRRERQLPVRERALLKRDVV